MKVNNINLYSNSISVQKTPKFQGNFINKTKKGLVPLILAGGLMMTQPAKADDHMENFYPENEVSVPSGDYPMRLLKGMLVGAALLYGCLWGINTITKSDKDNKNENVYRDNANS